MKFYRTGRRGSFTVEAALIMPVILGVIVLFIYFAMFAHDRCAMEYVCEDACTLAVYERGSGEDEIERYVSEGLEKRLILDWDKTVASYSDETAVYIRLDAVSPVFRGVYSHTARAVKHFCPKY